MKRPKYILYFLILQSLLFFNSLQAQLTFSPYSRYGLGELNGNEFAPAKGMGGTFIGLKPDTAAPVFINIANPAAIAGIRLTTLELGGHTQFTEFSNGTTAIKTRNINFSYAAMGIPLKQRAALSMGIMPHSNVGYNLRNTVFTETIGDVKYEYTGEGGINKLFLGFGINPFKKMLTNFSRSAYKDSLVKNKHTTIYKRKKFSKELLSELSVGARADYLFGSILHTSSVIYPNANYYYNTRRYRAVSFKDVTGSFGLQTSFTIDSVKNRELRKKVKIAFGYFMNLGNTINVKNSTLGYNYSLNDLGNELVKDTFIFVNDNPNTIRLPMEQGFGVSLRKGDMIAVAAEAAYMNWSQFRYLGSATEMKNSFRVAAGINFIPNKNSAGASAYLKRIQYRIGGFYKTGSLELNNTEIVNYGLTVGLGLPVGIYRQFSMVNISAQLGEMGSINNNLVRERYAKIVLGFTFNDKWFNKFRYD